MGTIDLKHSEESGAKNQHLPAITVDRVSVFRQYLATIVVGLLPLGHGLCCGWTSPNILILTSDDSPLPSGPITMKEASSVASILCLGALFGNIFFGFITSKFGRKWPLILMTIPTIISWLLMFFAQNVYYLLAFRFSNGFIGGGFCAIVPLFLSEIAIDRVRGSLGSTYVMNLNIGILLVFIFGDYFDYYMTPKFVIALTVVCAILLLFFPETPVFLVKQNKISEAEESIRFYQSLSRRDGDCALLQSEIKKLKSSVGDANSKTSFKWSDVTTGAGKKAMIIGIVLSSLNQLCGCFAMLQYTASIFKEAGSSMDPNTSAIVVGFIQVIGSYFATILVDRAGRKILFVTSSIGIALGLITLAVYMMLKSTGYEIEAFNWIPIASFSFVIFIASWAVQTLPFLVITEILPINVRDFGISVCITVLCALAFLLIKFLPFLIVTLGFPGTLFIFAFECLASAIFIILYMPETKGKSYEEIMKLLQ